MLTVDKRLYSFLLGSTASITPIADLNKHYFEDPNLETKIGPIAPKIILAPFIYGLVYLLVGFGISKTSPELSQKRSMGYFALVGAIVGLIFAIIGLSLGIPQHAYDMEYPYSILVKLPIMTCLTNMFITYPVDLLLRNWIE